ncbi:hypothetical protein MtrunA17_Chr5g0426191 [Medicago truncatula]|uniref:Uncharacterized protein n=1 Tax=Medicago truncatula TaxID=3880 RepID=A0A072UE56_MEDTR|nr:hypothetical protein MTR_5g063995 [Medicago truncatula]RHN56139.1 hypothetical protein MtrunA17_Chr5g0426191 [Medicago truncatula]
MIDRLRLYDTKEIWSLQYEKYMISLKIKCLDSKISLLNERCDSYEVDQLSSNCKEKKEVINIDYNTQLQNILDDFLVSNQFSFDKFDVQCGDLVEKAQESQRKLVKMETECHKVVVEENPKVRSVDICPKSEPMGVKEITLVKIYARPSLRWESFNSKRSTLSAWEYLILCAKFMEFLPNKRKKKGDIFLLSFLPP